MLPNSPASQQNLNMLGKFQDGSEKFQGGHTAALVVEEKNSVSAAKEANSNVKGTSISIMNQYKRIYHVAFDRIE